MLAPSSSPWFKCDLWDCSDQAVDGEAVCESHLVPMLDGILDDCPFCDQLKYTQFFSCGDCEFYPDRNLSLSSEFYPKRRSDLDWDREADW